MPSASDPMYRTERARRAARARWSKPQNVERRTQAVEERIRELVAAAPPLSDEQLARLRVIFAPAVAELDREAGAA